MLGRKDVNWRNRLLLPLSSNIQSTGCELHNTFRHTSLLWSVVFFTLKKTRGREGEADIRRSFVTKDPI
jgi:hypothetical protein